MTAEEFTEAMYAIAHPNDDPFREKHWRGLELIYRRIDLGSAVLVTLVDNAFLFPTQYRLILDDGVVATYKIRNCADPWVWLRQPSELTLVRLRLMGLV